MNEASPAESNVDAAGASSVEVAYDEILRRIVNGELPVGCPLRSTVLARELGTSRTPVVQAIARLLAEGLLTQQRNHRAEVAEGASRWFMDLHEVRILLEPPAAAAAAGTIPDAKLDQLDAAAARCEAVLQPGGTEVFHFDHDLHTTLADYSGNLMLKSIVHKCMAYKRFAYTVPGDPPQRRRRAHREHLEILHAVRRGDSDTAAAAMLFHLRNTVRDLPDIHVV